MEDSNPQSNQQARSGRNAPMSKNGAVADLDAKCESVLLVLAALLAKQDRVTAHMVRYKMGVAGITPRPSGETEFMDVIRDLVSREKISIVGGHLNAVMSKIFLSLPQQG